MTIEKLKQDLSALALSFVPDDTHLSLIDKIHNAHVRKVSSALNDILLKEPLPDNVYELLENYLKEHWEETKGTAVSYTAISNSDVVTLLCAVAEIVCDSKKDQDSHLMPLELLMPDLMLESIKPGYMNLKIVEKSADWNTKNQEEMEALFKELAISKNSEEEIEAHPQTQHSTSTKEKLDAFYDQLKAIKNILDRFLLNSEQQSNLNGFLEELDTISKIKWENDDIQKMNQLSNLLNKKINFYQEQYGCSEKQNYLIPSYKLSELLSQSIISDDGITLIPIATLLHEEEDNPYSISYEKISPEELRRLTAHSPESRALDEARKNLDRLKSDKSNLLGHLTQLIKQLRLNDAREGVGSEENAGSGAYPAIIAFADYYGIKEDGKEPSNGLDSTEKAKIPDDLRQGIESLLSLASDPQKNINATTNFDTCVFVQRTKYLEPLVEEYAPLLSTIACSKDRKEGLIIQREQEVKSAEKALRLSLEKNTYQGADTLPITQKLLNSLDINITVNSLADLNMLMTLTPKEITDVLNKNEKGKRNEALSSVLKSIEELVVFIHQTPLDKLKAFLEVTGIHLISRLCQDRNDVYALLLTLPSERFVYMANLLKKEQWEWDTLAYILHSEPQLLKNLLEKVIPEPERLKAVTTPNEERETVLHLIANNPEQIQEVLKLIPESDRLKAVTTPNEERETVLHLIANNPEQIQEVLKLIPEPERPALIKEKNKYGDTILHTAASDPEAVKAILELIPESERLVLINEKNKSGNTVLHKAAIKYPEAVKAILELIPAPDRIALIQEKFQKDKTILHLTVSNSNLLNSILKLAPQSMHLQLIKEKDKDENTVLHSASGNSESIQKILGPIPESERLALINEKNKSGNTVLHIAATRNLEAVKAILELIPAPDCTALIKEKFQEDKTILHLAENNSNLLDWILKLAPRSMCLELIKERDKDGNTVLHAAAGNPDSIQKILESIPESDRLELIKEKNKDGNTVLHAAAGNPESIQKILESIPESDRLALIKEKNRWGRTLLHQAAGNPRSVQQILESIPESERLNLVKEKDGSKNTVLHRAAFTTSSVQKILTLLLSDSDRLEAIKEKGEDGNTMLFEAMFKVEALQKTLELISEPEHLTLIEQQNNYGNTILHKAVLVESPECVQKILELIPKESLKTILDKKNNAGKTVLDLASKKKELLKIIEGFLDACNKEEPTKNFRDAIEDLKGESVEETKDNEPQPYF
ncbi:TPA: ankyrin repeat domain-containing protein [Legionella anisa]